MSFIRINNRNNFLIKNIKNYNPESSSYNRYWRNHKKLSIEGLWSLDNADIIIDLDDYNKDALTKKHKEGWRWMPPNLYFYCNLGTILHNEDGAPKTAPKKKIRPYLRDIEWEFFYNWMEARGFSGFEGDTENTCYREVLKEDFILDDYRLTCYDGNKKFIDKKWLNVAKWSEEEDSWVIKNYVPAREYLRKLYSQPLGLAMWENGAQNLFMLGARGFGKSFMVGVGVVLHELLFDGAREYTQESISNPYTVEILVGAAIAGKSADMLSKTTDALDNLPGSWGKGEDYLPSPFYKQMMGSIKPNNVKNPYIHWYEKNIGGQWRKIGTKSNVKHVTFTIENPEAAAGTRPGIIIVEEVGLAPNILTIHGSNAACQMEGSIKFGSSIYLGTGGNMEKIIESEQIFYDPEGFDFLAFDNEWEENDLRKIGWFVPAIYGLNRFKDENGNTDVERALKYKQDERHKKKRAKNTSAIDLEMMNYPLVPSEMFLSKSGNMFPIALMTERKGELEGNDTYLNAEYIGRLDINHTTDRIDWKLDPKQRPIRTFPLREADDKEGCVVIYQHPYEDADGDVMYGRYIAGCDPYDHDGAGTTSLGSTIVYDKLTKQVVAEYTGRPKTAKEYYENVRKLVKYYNGKLLYENERKGIYDYFEAKNSVHLLQEQPEIIKDVIQSSKVQRKYGMHMTTALKRYGEELIKTWLLESYNDEEDSEKLNVHELRCLPLLSELIKYNTVGNFDRVMAFMMVMYFIQEVRKIEIKSERKAESTYIGNASFFQKGISVKPRR